MSKSDLLKKTLGLVCCFSLILTNGMAQTLIYQESFETDGEAENPPRYTTPERDVFDIPRIESELGNFEQRSALYWAHNFEIEAALGTDANIGIVIDAPARRAVLTWHHMINPEDVTDDAKELIDSLIDWLVEGEGSTDVRLITDQEIGELDYPGDSVLIERLEAKGFTVTSGDFGGGIAQFDENALLIVSSATPKTAFATFDGPMLTYNGTTLDNLLLTSKGSTLPSTTIDRIKVDESSPLSVSGELSFVENAQIFSTIGANIPEEGQVASVADFIIGGAIPLENLATVDELISGASPSAQATSEIDEADLNAGIGGLNFVDSAVPGGLVGGFGLRGVGTLDVTMAGTFSFAAGSKDGSRLRIDVDRNGFDEQDTVVEFDRIGAFSFAFGDVEISQPGAYDFEWVAFNSEGDFGAELWMHTFPEGGQTGPIDPNSQEFDVWLPVADFSIFGAFPISLSGPIEVTSYVGADSAPVTEERPLLLLVEGGAPLLGNAINGWEGDGFFAGAGLDKWGVAPKLLTLQPVNVAGHQDLKLTFMIAGTDLDYETSDFFEVWVDPTNSGSFEQLARFTAPSSTDKFFTDGVTRVGNRFRNVQYDLPEGSTELVVEFRARTTFFDEVIAIDNIRISSGAAPGGPAVANAGVDQTLTLASGQSTVDVILDGAGSHGGEGTVSAYDWEGTPDPENVVRPTVTLGAGTHVFTLQVSNDLGSTSDPDQVSIEVNAPAEVPVEVASGFRLQEDFNSLDQGALDGQNGWTAFEGTQVVADPGDAGNQVLASSTAGGLAAGNFILPITPMPDGGISTMFLRFRSDEPLDSLDWSMGPTDNEVDLGSSWGDMRAILNNNNSAGTPPGAQLSARDGGGYDRLVDMESETWYKTWVILDNASDTYRVYLQGGAYSEITLLVGADDGQEAFEYRNGATDQDLIRFMARLNGDRAGTLYVDDIYVDPSGMNLDDPTVGFALQEDFDSLAQGGLDGQNEWMAFEGAQVVADPADASNQVVAASTAGGLAAGNLVLPITAMPDGGVSTMFLRFRSDEPLDSLDWSMGPTDNEVDLGSSWGDMRAILNNNNSAGTPPGAQLSARDGGGYDRLVDMEPETWYKTWLILDNATDTYEIYLQGGAYSQITKISGADDGQESFEYRNGATDQDLIRLMVRLNGDRLGTVYLDDIYVDPSGMNLADPSANFELQEDFNTLALGALDGQNEWAAFEGAQVVADPADAGNQVVAASTAGGLAAGNFVLPITRMPDGGISTMYMRFRSDEPLDSLDWSIGPTDNEVDLSSSWGDMRAILNNNNAAGTPAGAQLSARDGGGYDRLIDMESETWYKTWLILDNDADTYQIYIQGGVYSEVTQLVGADDGQESFEYRNGTTDQDLIRFMARLNGDRAGTVYVDDIYVDPNGMNLGDPASSGTSSGSGSGPVVGPDPEPEPGPVVPAMANLDDTFADGDRSNTGGLQADWWSSNSTGGNSVEAYPGQLGLVTGTSGRGIHGTFAPQTLEVGEGLVTSLTFRTPATVGTDRGSAFKFAIMDLNDPGLAADLSSSSSSVNPLFTSLPGYLVDFDVNTGEGANTAIRKHDVPNDTGRFLGTTGEWSQLGSSSSASYSFTADTEYMVGVSVMRTGEDSLEIMAWLSQGEMVLDSHTESDSSEIANNFGMLGIWVNSNTFGSTNTHGEFEDNGITFSNIKVERLAPAPSVPSLVIERSGGDVVLSWPADGGGFELESTSSLGAPNWSQAGTPTVVGGMNQVTIPAADGQMYFRLNSPGANQAP